MLKTAGTSRRVPFVYYFKYLHSWTPNPIMVSTYELPRVDCCGAGGAGNLSWRRADGRKVADRARVRALGAVVADEVLEELHNLRRVAQAVPRLGLARGLGDDGPYAAEAAHDGEGVLVGHVVADVHGEDVLGRVLRELLHEPLHGLALVPVDGRAQLIDHLAVGLA